MSWLWLLSAALIAPVLAETPDGGQQPPTAVVTPGAPAPQRQQPAPMPPPQPGGYVANPHWTTAGCATCHAGATGPIAADRVDNLCLSCHDGVKARRDAHPIGRSFENDQVRRPDGWPLEDGKLGCATCHKIVSACNRAAQRPRDNPAFLRGFRPGKLRAFCAECHLDLGDQQRYNPHVMLNADGSSIHRSCRFCHHAELTDRTRLTRAGDPQLRADPVSLCLSCHSQHIDYFEPGHIGHAVTPDIKAHMIASDNRFAATRDTNSAMQHPAALPLGDGDRLVCSTCHNPHQVGVFPSESVLAIGAQSPDDPNARAPAFRGFGKELCFACHEK